MLIPAPPPATNAEDGAAGSGQPSVGMPEPQKAPPSATPMAAASELAHAEFAAAVKDALREFHSPDLLARNPLLRHGIRDLGMSAGPLDLKALLSKTVSTLFGNPRDEKLRQVIELTYFQPPTKQEVVADRLSLSFATYRRHLSTARDRLARWLWERSHVAPTQTEPPSAAGPTAKGEKPEGEAATAPELPVSFVELADPQMKNITRPVRAYRVEGKATATVTDRATVAPPLALPDKPSIAVLPFQNMSGDPEQEYFVDGMVEEIITALSRIRWLFVIARNSSFSYKGQSPDVRQVGRELGVRYVLEGSVRKAGGRVRITGQLIHAATGAHLWADRFDGSLEDVFELQDKVASSVAGVIEPALQAAETARSASRPTADLTAYDLYLRAYEMVWSSAGQIPEALRLTEQAIARDPRYGPALAWAAYCCFRLLRYGQSEDPEADRRKGTNVARRALEVAGDDPDTLANAAFALAYFGEDIGAMMTLVDRALALNANFARGWHLSGNLRFYAGQPDIAIEHVEAALRLSPRARVGNSLAVIGAAHFVSRRFDQAVPKLLVAIQEDPSFPTPYRYLAACYAHMGRLDNAREIVTRLRAFTSVVIPDASDIPLRSAEHRELYLSGLRLAAVEAA